MSLSNTSGFAYAWRVVINGKDSGIIETNLGFAVDYWKEREKQLERQHGKRFKCELIQLGA
jgi:hypothetical protein